MIRIRPARRSFRFRRSVATAAIAAVFSIPLAARAQDTLSAPADSVTTAAVVDTVMEASIATYGGPSPLLSEDHWAVRAAWRAEALGLARFLPAQRAVPRAAVADALAEAARTAEAGRPEYAALTRGWLRRFTDEFTEFGGESAWRRGPGAALLGSALTAGAARAEGRLAPPVGVYDFRQPARELDDATRASLGWESGFGLGRVAVASWDVRVETDGDGGASLRVPRWDAAVGARGWQLAVGEGPVGYGPSPGGGVVLSSPLFVPRLEVQTTRPTRLPWVLGALGSASLHTFVSRLDDARHPGEPWMWGARAAFQPHARFTVGISRASIFGGDSIDAGVTPENLLKMLVGVLSEEFENQLVAMDFRWRLPTERALPATLYLEWGADDGSGAWWDVPGIVGGAFFPALPGLSEVGLGAEYTYFGERCCGHGPWYYHSTFRGNWARGGLALAHPLGGDGSEAALYLRADLLDAALRLDARGFTRERGVEPGTRTGNLFAPERGGRSLGFTVNAAVRLLPRAELRAASFLEDGDGWSERRFEARLGYFF